MNGVLNTFCKEQAVLRTMLKFKKHDKGTGASYEMLF